MAAKVLPSSLELCWGCSSPFYIPKKWLFINILLSRHQPSSPKALDGQGQCPTQICFGFSVSP